MFCLNPWRHVRILEKTSDFSSRVINFPGFFVQNGSNSVFSGSVSACYLECLSCFPPLSNNPCFVQLFSSRNIDNVCFVTLIEEAYVAHSNF